MSHPAGEVGKSWRVLFLCTGNSARSQIAEAVLRHRGRGRFVAASAGAAPATQVNPDAIEVLRASGIEWEGHAPRGLEGVEQEPWDLVITVCDRARESCPIFTGHPLVVHWSMPDPAAVRGGEEVRRAAFAKALGLIARRIDLLLAVPLEQMDLPALEERLRGIGRAGSAESEPAPPPA